MIREKLRKIPVPILGSINGILFGTFSEIVLRSAFLLEKYLREQKPVSAGLHISYLPYPFNWWYLPLLSFAIVTFATFIVHLYFNRYIKSSIWFWQMVSIVTLLSFFAASIIFAFYNWYFTEFEFLELYSVMSATKEDLFVLFILFPIIVIYNLLFAIVLKRIKMQLP